MPLSKDIQDQMRNKNNLMLTLVDDLNKFKCDKYANMWLLIECLNSDEFTHLRL